MDAFAAFVNARFRDRSDAGDPQHALVLRRAGRILAALCDRGWPVDVGPPLVESADGRHLVVHLWVGDTHGDLCIASHDALDLPEADFERRLAIWLAQCEAAAARPVCDLMDFVWDPWRPAAPVPDVRYADFAEGRGVDPASIAARVAEAVRRVDARHERVAQRFEQLYGLPMPENPRRLAVLEEALAMMDPVTESPHWLDRAAGMAGSWITRWYAPGGLDFEPIDASETSYFDEDVPDVAGPLDLRLESRYRLDAPQLITFASGDSDGLHWGLWYESPDYAPRIASNYARDDGYTSFSDRTDVLDIVRERISGDADPEGTEPKHAHYAVQSFRSRHIVSLHVHAVRDALGPPSERFCPWPVVGRPHGSPPIRLPADAGTSPDLPWSADLSELARAMQDARSELAAGRPAAALCLGLYLHYRDLDETREAGGALLASAYRAMGWTCFQEILREHLAHRGLRSVAVARPGPWPPPVPTPTEIANAPEALQVLWDWIHDQAPTAVYRLAAVQRARRFGLSFDDPTERAIAAYCPDEGCLAVVRDQLPSDSP